MPVPGCACESETGASCWSQARGVGPLMVVPANGANGGPGRHSSVDLERVLQTLCAECQLLGKCCEWIWVPASRVSLQL